jgi:hypothetical protein
LGTTTIIPALPLCGYTQGISVPPSCAETQAQL